MQAIQSETASCNLPDICSDVPGLSPAFWKPRFAGDGDMLRFTPFLFWLVAALKPSRTTVVGLGDGTSCFALCQAIERLAISGTCTGIHFSQKSQASTPDPVGKHALKTYEGLLDLRSAQGPADMPWPDLNNQHLLLIDLQQADEWPDESLDGWCSRLSSDGCLVVHGVKSVAHTNAVQRMQQRLSEASCIRIDVGAGLLVLCNTPGIFANLVDPASLGQLHQDALMMFVRLGSSLVAELRQEVSASELAKHRAALAGAEERVERLKAQTAELSAALDGRGRKLNQYQALYFDCESELKKLRRIEAEALDPQTERQKKDEALAERDALVEKLRQSRETHYRETAALTGLLEEQRRTTARDMGALQRQLDELRKQADALALYNHALLSSTSWKITSPLRRLASRIRGHARHR